MELFIAIENASKRTRLQREFEKEGYEIICSGSFADSINQLREHRFGVLVCEINLALKEGFKLLQVAKERDPNCLPILLTGVGSLEAAIEAVQCGAFDYISDPFDVGDLKAVIKRAELRWKSTSEQKPSDSPAPSLTPVAPKTLVGRSAGIVDVYRAVARATSSESSVLIGAETGTGKELVARAIHANSRRKDKRFIAINCAALTDTLLESELFGHLKGSFTGASQNKKGIFEEANGGTLFLDEIGDLSQAMQIKLLRVLQDGEIRPIGSTDPRNVDVRIIAATHRNLAEMVTREVFREDLLYRLKVITIKIPPLRERKEDIAELANYFLFRYANRERKSLAYISDEAIHMLQAYHWPGNVRELEHAVEYAVSMTSSPVIFPEDFPEEVRHPSTPTLTTLSQLGANPKTLDQVECEHIMKVLQFCDFNISKTAEVLAVDRGTLYRKAEKYQIPLKKKPVERVQAS